MKNILAIYSLFFTIVFGICLTVSCKKEQKTSPVPIVIDSVKTGLLAYYPFNNSAADASGNGNNGTVNNVTSIADRNNKPNAAFYFDGSMSYISIPDKTQLRLDNTSFTFNAWVKLASYNSSYISSILTKRSVSGDGWSWGITGNGSTTSGVLTYEPGAFFTSTGSHIIDINQWHMITIIYNLSSQQIFTYVDGVMNDTTNAIPSPNPFVNNLLYIGRDDPDIPSNGYFLHGSLDEVRIYGRVLGANEVEQLYTL